MDDSERYRKAKERVEEIRSFYVHVVTYVAVNIVLFLINFMVSRGAWWFYWPLLGWGIGLFFHWFNVFGSRSFLGDRWEEKKISEIMEKDRQKEGSGE
jgi:hypothetical protein